MRPPGTGCTTVISATALLITLAGVAGQSFEPQTTGACASIIHDAPMPPEVCSLPTDPLQRCAIKALRGDYGDLRPWQRAGYQVALNNGVTVQGRAWVTSYYPQEGFREGQCTRSGRGVSLRSAAVQRNDWQRFRLCYVWTAAYGLRIVEDTGANSNTRVARRRGGAECRWLDYWFPRPRRGNPVTEYAIWGREAASE